MSDNKQVLSLPAGFSRIESHEQEQVLVAWLQTKVMDTKIKFASAIPSKKIETARLVCEVPKDEHVLAFVDGTTFGSAKECLLICWSSVYCKWSPVFPPLIIDFPTFIDIEIDVAPGNVDVMIGSDVYFSPGWADISAVVCLLKSLQKSLVDGVFVTEEEIKQEKRQGWYFDWIRGLILGILICLFYCIKILMTSVRINPEHPELLVIALIISVLFFGIRKRKK
ncbi:MAG: hypothetical protein K8S27_12555 [Candidatus Omnitrophica bacterium]|nr:hypothetical protein [Candidatus Omnitrophota bacterium]